MNNRVLIGSTQSANDTVYLHTDHLGSVEATTNALGQFVNRMSFSAWGERQKPDWKPGNPAETFLTTNGFTGHDQLDSHNLIHMGGRVYDPSLGRFLSADLFIQSPYDTQNYNRYSYVGNNPLSFIDPTGYRRGVTGSMCDANSCTTVGQWPSGVTTDQLSYLGSLQNGSTLTSFYGGTNSANLQFYGGLIGGVFADPTAAGTESVIALAEAIDAGFSQANSALGVAVAAGSNAARKAAGVGLERTLASLGRLGRIAMASPVGAAVMAMTPTKIGDGTVSGSAAYLSSRSTEQNPYRGRIQAQGGGLEKSVAWAQNFPPTTAQGLAMLNQLKASLSTKEIKERERSFNQAERFINNAGRAGGVTAPVSRSFPQGSAIRVDIEIITGQAFVP